ncbi:MAG: hypothetical protein OXO54_09290 [Chloroflexota bacterium]|nr:hypothetical protein [Chloroflexota bacterium]MDE2898503.1 hypothetical protein [Chloroflexota bacterium]
MFGIYQKIFGDQAEAACQNDHRENVRRMFAWTMSEEPTTTTPTPVQDGGYTFTGTGNTLVLERIHIKGGRYISSTEQEHFIVAYLSHSGDTRDGGIFANNCNNGTNVDTIRDGLYRLRVLVLSSDSPWTITLQPDLT